MRVNPETRTFTSHCIFGTKLIQVDSTTFGDSTTEMVAFFKTKMRELIFKKWSQNELTLIPSAVICTIFH